MKKLLGPAEVIHKWSKRVSETLDADVIFYSGEISEPFDFTFIGRVRRHKLRPNAFFILTTPGGSADAAYRMMRYLQERYEDGKITIFVPRYCKSAGTLMAVGADEIVMSEVSEIGPLDVQVRKPDELGEWTSGLTPLQALTALRAEAFNCFEQHFLLLRDKSAKQITAKTAAEIAVKLTTGWFQPIYEQLDPMRLSETQRAMMIALQYGERLSRGNIDETSLKKLIGDYPSHGFIIDRSEAAQLFSEVRPPSEDEAKLSGALMKSGVIQKGMDPEAEWPEIWFLSQEGCKVSADIDWKGEEHEEEKPNSKEATSKQSPATGSPSRLGDQKSVPANGDGNGKTVGSAKKPIVARVVRSASRVKKPIHPVPRRDPLSPLPSRA